MSWYKRWLNSKLVKVKEGSKMPKKQGKKLVNMESYTQKKQERKRGRWLYYLFICLFSCILLLSVYTISPLSKINNLTADGNTFLTDKAIVTGADIQVGDSLWTVFLHKSELEKRLKKNEPAVKTASFNVSHFNDVTIAIDETPTVAYQSIDNNLHPVLENGVLDKRTVTTTYGNEPILSAFDEKNLRVFITGYNTLDPAIKQLISEVSFSPTTSNPKRLIFYMNDGNQVYANVNSFPDRMSYYLVMVETIGEEKGIFQLEVGAYFTPFKQDEADVELDSDGNEDKTDETESDVP